LEQRLAAQMTLRCVPFPALAANSGHAAALVGGFTHFDNYRQLIAMAGFFPGATDPGNFSIRGRQGAHHCIGGGLIRGNQLMQLRPRKRTRPQRPSLIYLVAKGKNKKLALIAVCNKLLSKPL
jgi:hypothetical protein